MQTKVTIRDTGVPLAEILRLIGDGYSYDQILMTHKQLNLGDIMAAAKFGCDLVTDYVTADGLISVEHPTEYKVTGNRVVNLTKARKDHPRAFETWTTNEDNQLVSLFKRGEKVGKIAEIHKRNPGAIRARLQKLGLMDQ